MTIVTIKAFNTAIEKFVETIDSTVHIKWENLKKSIC